MPDTIVTEPITDVITTLHKRALKHSDSIVFRLYKGQATVEAYLRETSPINPTGFELKVVIHAGGVHVTDYNREHTYVPDDEGHRYSGFEMTSIYSDVIRTLVDRIPVGGTLNLLWDRNGYSNEITREAGLIVDHLKLAVRRKGHHEDRPDIYLVTARVGLDNSARMVKLDWNGA